MKKSHIYQIIGQQGQVLQYVLFPGQEISIASPALYGSPQIYSKQKDQRNQFYGLINKSYILRKLKNQQQNIQYIGLKKSQGKILVLENAIYGNMYVRKDKVLAVGYEFIPNLSCPQMKQFGMYLEKNVEDYQSKLFLQSNNNTYIQKCLGAKQKISCQKESLLAFNNSIGVTVTGTMVTLQGPGFVFITTQDIDKNKKISPIQLVATMLRGVVNNLNID